ncbi:hypothetical protein [Klebsiella pneumoniae]|uniref:hypothetical protein n=1 Tax=Klebsiella pneumoniae TaxID=573 RepID=UPI000FDC0432|nr:hypothetical protein [Klebsiella pneumoniae]RVS47862.1 hypothetical protein EOL09_08635 [Klebsiella pneumoniae]
MTPDQIYQILLGGLGLFGGIWIRRLQSDIRDLEKAVERIKDEYQRREDSSRDHDQLIDRIRDIKESVDRVLEKLDKKADRT